jgi:hypothetical protein
MYVSLSRTLETVSFSQIFIMLKDCVLLKLQASVSENAVAVLSDFYETKLLLAYKMLCDLSILFKMLINRRK